jgi:SAM-dependent methyltransferase
MSLRQHEIAEANHRILNPFTDEKLMTLGTVCRLRPGQRVLDLACGKGELLCRWAHEFGIHGHGIDISTTFLTAAAHRANELDVANQVTFEQGDASTTPVETAAFDIVTCIGATWIGSGIQGTVDLMRPALHEPGLILIGEPYWLAEPPPAAFEALECAPDEFTTLWGTCERLAASGVEVVEMVLADDDSWDRYVAGQWWTINDWLRAHPDDTEAPDMRTFLDKWRRSYLEYGRRYLGWGVFVGRPSQAHSAR